MPFRSIQLFCQIKIVPLFWSISFSQATNNVNLQSRTLIWQNSHFLCKTVHVVLECVSVHTTLWLIRPILLTTKHIFWLNVCSLWPNVMCVSTIYLISVFIGLKVFCWHLVCVWIVCQTKTHHQNGQMFWIVEVFVELITTMCHKSLDWTKSV